MVTEWFLSWASGVIRWLIGFLPDWTLPTDFTATGGQLDQILANAAGLGVWVDWAGIAFLAMIPIGVWIIGLSWKALRTAFSHFPFIGGSG